MRQDKQYWMELSARYFDAETTGGEEARLRAFAATTEDPDFDELRAVMGFVAVGRRMEHEAKEEASRASIRRPYWRLVGVAASLVLLVGLAAFWPKELTEPDCVAYVNGREVTNPDQVMELMQQTMHDLTADLSQDPIESQLREMFEKL